MSTNQLLLLLEMALLFLMITPVLVIFLFESPESFDFLTE